MTLRVNGEAHEIAFAPTKTLLEVLREELNLTGTKHGGEPRLSCLVLALDCEETEITTVEGLATADGPHPLQVAFADLGASQCGYCSPGFLVSAKALLETNPDPDRETLRTELAGNLCRCTGYLKIFEAIERAAAEMREAAHE